MNPLFTKGQHFFEDIQPERDGDLSLAVVTHLLNTPAIYLDCLSRFANLAMVLPKPKSICRRSYELLEKRFPIVCKQRQQLNSVEVVAAILNDHVETEKLILVDIGGYFAGTLAQLPPRLNSKLAGVVEVTENGYQRYRDIDELPVPVLSIARSPLKGPEDYLTGQSIVYSAEALMRECHHIMNGGNAVVFGYGKIGRSIAKALHEKNVNTKVVEIDPIRAIEARSRGFDLIDKKEALGSSDVIFCATGNQSINNHDFNRIKNGAFIFSVTSSDDELDLCRADANFEVSPVTNHIARYERLGQYFYLANDGNAINFIHNAEVGPYIYLVQGEVIKAIHYMQADDLENGLHQLPVGERRDLASRWLAHFA